MASTTIPALAPVKSPAAVLRSQANQAGLFVTESLGTAREHCKEKVQRIVKECKRGNRRFRDIEFDLIEDQDRCLYGLQGKPEGIRGPRDVLRVTDIYEAPELFIHGAKAGDIVQGNLEDCWFLSALAVVATRNLIEPQIYVHGNQEVGIYGFVFWRDSGWVDVIIDDLLFTTIPPWDDLEPPQKDIYHRGRVEYNKTARRGGRTLYFAKSREENETWVPLIEKAYAKLHGDYAALNGGFTAEAVEDLTGGVSTLVFTHDILDTDRFWNEELTRARADRAFSCFIATIAERRNDQMPPRIVDSNGLIPAHAYSVTRAIECFDPNDPAQPPTLHRFLRIRNPWGREEWKGPWSDGSREWSTEFGRHVETAFRADGNKFEFGEDGFFVQKYEDFLESWNIIERCILFNKQWRMSSQWLKVPVERNMRCWRWGDVSYTINIEGPHGDSDDDGDDDPGRDDDNDDRQAETTTDVVIVLAQLDGRYFRGLTDRYQWSLEFALYCKGRENPIASSIHSVLWARSVKMEVQLKPGQYVVQVRIDRQDNPKKIESALVDKRKLGRKRMEYATSLSIAANFDASEAGHALVVPETCFAGKDIDELTREYYRRFAQARRGSLTLAGLSEQNAQARYPVTSEPLPNEGTPQHAPIPSTPTSTLVEAGTGGIRSSGSRPHSSDRSRRMVGSHPSETPGPARLQIPATPNPYPCSACQREIQGEAYRCSDVKCHQKLLCRNCRNHHCLSHRHLTLEVVDDALLESSDDMCHYRLEEDLDWVVLGLRVYTNKADKGFHSTVDGQLRFGELVRSHFFTTTSVDHREPAEAL